MANKGKPDTARKARASQAAHAKPAARSAQAKARVATVGSNDANEQGQVQQALAASFTHNAIKHLETGRENAVAPPQGVAVVPDTPSATASTLSERNESTKTGAVPSPGTNPN